MVSTISQTRHERLATRDEYSSAHNKWHPHLGEKASTLPKHPSDNLEVEPEALPLSADHTTRGQPALHVLVEVGRVSIKDLVSMPLALSCPNTSLANVCDGPTLPTRPTS
jgi:hypothetical protein